MIKFQRNLDLDILIPHRLRHLFHLPINIREDLIYFSRNPFHLCFADHSLGINYLHSTSTKSIDSNGTILETSLFNCLDVILMPQVLNQAKEQLNPSVITVPRLLNMIPLVFIATILGLPLPVPPVFGGTLVGSTFFLGALPLVCSILCSSPSLFPPYVPITYYQHRLF